MDTKVYDEKVSRIRDFSNHSELFLEKKHEIYTSEERWALKWNEFDKGRISAKLFNLYEKYNPLEYKKFVDDTEMPKRNKADIRVLIEAQMILRILDKQIEPLQIEASTVHAYIFRCLTTDLKKIADEPYSSSLAAQDALEAFGWSNLPKEMESNDVSLILGLKKIGATVLAIIIFISIMDLTSSLIAAFIGSALSFIIGYNIVGLRALRNHNAIQKTIKNAAKDERSLVVKNHAALRRFINANLMDLEQFYPLSKESQSQEVIAETASVTHGTLYNPDEPLSEEAKKLIEDLVESKPKDIETKNDEHILKKKTETKDWKMCELYSHESLSVILITKHEYQKIREYIGKQKEDFLIIIDEITMDFYFKGELIKEIHPHSKKALIIMLKNRGIILRFRYLYRTVLGLKGDKVLKSDLNHLYNWIYSLRETLNDDLKWLRSFPRMGYYILKNINFKFLLVDWISNSSDGVMDLEGKNKRIREKEIEDVIFSSSPPQRNDSSKKDNQEPVLSTQDLAEKKEYVMYSHSGREELTKSQYQAKNEALEKNKDCYLFIIDEVKRVFLINGKKQRIPRGPAQALKLLIKNIGNAKPVKYQTLFESVSKIPKRKRYEWSVNYWDNVQGYFFELHRKTKPKKILQKYIENLSGEGYKLNLSNSKNKKRDHRFCLIEFI